MHRVSSLITPFFYCYYYLHDKCHRPVCHSCEYLMKTRDHPCSSSWNPVTCSNTVNTVSLEWAACLSFSPGITQLYSPCFQCSGMTSGPVWLKDCRTLIRQAAPSTTVVELHVVLRTMTIHSLLECVMWSPFACIDARNICGTSILSNSRSLSV